MASKGIVRRKHVRQQRADSSPALWRRLSERFGLLPYLLGVVFALCSTAIALYGPHSKKYSVGQKIEHPIYAEADFELVDERETLRLKQVARAATPSSYGINGELILRVESELRNLYQAVQEAESVEAFQKAAVTSGWVADEVAYSELRSYADDASRFEASIIRLKNRLASERTWNPESSKERSPAPTSPVVLVYGVGRSADVATKPREVSVFELTPTSHDTSLRRGADDLAVKSQFAPALRVTVANILVRHMAESPMLVYDQVRTNDAMALSEEQVAAFTKPYKAGQPIVSPDPDQGLTPADIQLLDTHDIALRAFLSSPADGAMAMRERIRYQQIGITAILALATLGLCFYVGMYQPRIFEVPARGVALVALLLATLLLARIIDARAPVRELIFGPPLFATAVLAVAYSRRFAVGVMTITAMMLVLSVGGDIAMLVTLTIGMFATVYMLKEIRTRTRLLWVGGMSAGGVFAASLAFGLVGGQAVGFAASRASWAGGAAMMSAILIHATLPVIERVFRIATALTLLEWRDTTKPLLQRLAQEAPGTYAHSLSLGSMAEAACATIGANGLLTQVGALYHDVGKLHKAEYFAENQEASINRHDNLAPTMSLLIILGHVKDGVEMAKEYKLPRVLIQFIEEHHGTTVVRYFHTMASEQQPRIAKGKHDREVPEAQFRYPGPKPRCKETAVLMLCDGVEGAVRALGEPTPGRIEHVVNEIVTDRLHDGQFDECDITLRELHRVRESLVKTLCSLYHGRVAYPKSRDKQEREPESVAG